MHTYNKLIEFFEPNTSVLNAHIQWVCWTQYRCFKCTHAMRLSNFIELSTGV